MAQPSLSSTPARSHTFPSASLLFLFFPSRSTVTEQITQASNHRTHRQITHGQHSRRHHHHPRPHLHRVTPHHHRMTGSMDHRGDDNSDNSSDITELTDSVDLDQEEGLPTTNNTTTNPDPSIVLDTNPAPVTQPPTTSTQTTKKRTKATNNAPGPSTVSPPTASGSSHPRTRRSARLSELASPDADQATSTITQGNSSTTGGAVGKGKKRATAVETEAGPSKKQ